MPKRCSAPGCQSNYDSSVKSEGIVSAFKFPSEASQREKWIRAIPRSNWTPGSSAVLCVKHFRECDVEKTIKVVGENGEVVDAPKLRPVLVKSAIPCIFPNLPSQLSKPSAPARPSPEKKMADICRLCLFVVHDCIPLYDNDNQLLSMIQSFLPLSEAWSESLELPAGVCAGCAAEVRRAYAFCEAAEHTQRRLLAALEADSLLTLYNDLRIQIKQEAEDSKEGILNAEEEDNKENKINIGDRYDTEDTLNKENIDHKEDKLIEDNGDYKEDLINTISDALQGETEFHDRWEETYNFSSDDDQSLARLHKEKVSAEALGVCRARKEQKQRICKMKKDKKERHGNHKDSTFFPEGTPEEDKKWQCLSCLIYLQSRSSLLNHYKSEHACWQRKQKM